MIHLDQKLKKISNLMITWVTGIRFNKIKTTVQKARRTASQHHTRIMLMHGGVSGQSRLETDTIKMERSHLVKTGLEEPQPTQDALGAMEIATSNTFGPKAPTRFLRPTTTATRWPTTVTHGLVYGIPIMSGFLHALKRLTLCTHPVLLPNSRNWYQTRPTPLTTEW